MNRLENLIRLLALLALLLGTSPASSYASQPTFAPDKLPGDFRNFQNFGSLDHQPASQEELAASNSTGLEMIGHLGGLTDAVALDGNYAYLATGGELAVLDVSDLAHPHRVGAAVYPFYMGQIDCLFLSKGRAYFTGNIGLGVVDVSDPFKPVYLGAVVPDTSIVTSITDMAIYEDYAYLTQVNNIWIYDLSGPGLPQLAGSFSMGAADQFDNILISGQFAYFVTSLSSARIPRLGILDLTSPSVPLLVGELENLLWGVLAVQGSYAYIIASDFPDKFPASYLQVVDVSDPAHPSLIKSTEIGVDAMNITSLEALGQTLYITMSSAQPTEGLLVYSLQDPTQPVFEGSAATQDSAYDVAISPDQIFAVVADHGRGLRVIDLSNPAHPYEVGAYDPPSIVQSVGVAGDYAFTSSGEYGIRSIDISDPSNPITIGFVPAWGPAYDLHVSGDYAYVAELNGGGIRVYNISDPAHMSEIASVGGSYSRFVESGGYLYAWQSSYGTLSVIDVRDPYHPVKLGSFTVPDSFKINDVALTGSLAYIAVSDYGCMIVDVSNPGNPQLVGYCSPEDTWDVDISGRYAYLIIVDYHSSTFFTLRVLDIINPLAPVQVGEYPIPGYGIPSFGYHNLNADGNLVFLYSLFQQTLIILDVSNPQFPHQVGSSGYGNCNALVREGDMVYLGSNGGLALTKFASSINGRVTDASGYLVPGVLVNSSPGISATTGADGSYAFKDLVFGSYWITPTLSGYTFDPPSRSVALPADNASQDFTLLPEPVTIMATPGITATLAYTGYQGDISHFQIPPGAFSQPVQVIVTPIVGSKLLGQVFTGHAFDLSAQDGQGPILDFGAPVTLTITYTNFDIRSVIDESKLVYYRWDGSGWVDAAATCTPVSVYARDPTANQITLPICQPGKYALYGPTHAILMPAILLNFR